LIPSGIGVQASVDCRRAFLFFISVYFLAITYKPSCQGPSRQSSSTRTAQTAPTGSPTSVSLTSTYNSVTVTFQPPVSFLRHSVINGFGITLTRAPTEYLLEGGLPAVRNEPVTVVCAAISCSCVCVRVCVLFCAAIKNALARHLSRGPHTDLSGLVRHSQRVCGVAAERLERSHAGLRRQLHPLLHECVHR
jgi:hypothetical protein